MKVVKLGEVFEFQNGRAFKKSEWKESGIPIIRIQNLNSENAGFNYFTGDYDERIIVNSGDLLFSWSGTVGTSFGPHIWKGPQALLNQHIFKVQTSESINRQYAYLSLLNITKEIENNVSGAVGLVHIKKSKLTEFLIPLPSLNAQKVTVEKLDKAFAEIDSLEKNLQLKEEKTNQLSQYMLSAAFTNTEEFDMKVVKLGEICEMYQPKTISTKEMVSDGQYTVFGANGPIGKYDQYNHESPQLLVTCRGATCGSVNISEPFSWINGNAMVIKPKESEVTFDYLRYAFIGGINVSGAITGSAQPQITRASLEQIFIPIPSVEHQQHIVDKLDKAFAEIDKVRLQISIENERISSLHHSILSGAFNFEEKVA